MGWGRGQQTRTRWFSESFKEQSKTIQNKKQKYQQNTKKQEQNKTHTKQIKKNQQLENNLKTITNTKNKQ